MIVAQALPDLQSVVPPRWVFVCLASMLACQPADDDQSATSTSVLELGSGPSLALDPPCGVAGSSVHVTGGGWPDVPERCRFEYYLFSVFPGAAWGDSVISHEAGIGGDPNHDVPIPEDTTPGRYRIGVKLIRLGGESPSGEVTEDKLLDSAVADFVVVRLKSVAWVDYERLCKTYGCDNPAVAAPLFPSAKKGKRIFPYADARDDYSIAVQAKLTGACPGMPVYFRSFDPSDPSTNDDAFLRRQYDCENGNTACDNRGKPRLGKLSEREPIYKTSVKTDDQGTAKVSFTTSLQPGDNYLVAASLDESYLDSVFVVGRYSLGAPGGDSLPNNRAQATELLTVWRRLRILYRKMSPPGTKNQLMGDLSAANCVSAAAYHHCRFEFVGYTLNFTAEDNTTTGSQYENGQFTLSDLILKVPPAGSQVNGQEWVITYLPGGQSATCPTTPPPEEPPVPPLCPTAGSFTLHDDDDDQNPELQTGLDLTWLQDPDQECTKDNRNKPCNMLLPAFIRPEIEEIATPLDWKANISDPGHPDFQRCYPSNKNWCVDVISLFQAEAWGDRDPDSEKVVLGRTKRDEGVAASGVYLETLRDAFFEKTHYNVRLKRTPVHEVGHALYACHNHTGIMCYPDPEVVPSNDDLKFTDKSIHQMRWLQKPGVLRNEIRVDSFVDCDDTQTECR